MIKEEVDQQTAGNLAGMLYATDRDDPALECGRLLFGVSENSVKTTILLVDRDSGLVRWNKSDAVRKLPMYITVTVKNPTPFDQLYDTALILVREAKNHFFKKEPSAIKETNPESFQEAAVQKRLRRVKRQDYCSQIKIIITLPNDNTMPVINLFGPTMNDTYMGYIGPVEVNNHGLGMNNFRCVKSVRSQDEFGTTGVDIECHPITISHLGDTYSTDFSFDVLLEVRIKSGVEPDTILNSGFALVHEEYIIVGLLDVVVSPARLPNISLVSCPTETISAGSVTKVSYNVFSPLASGDYMITCSKSCKFSPLLAVTAVHMFITMQNPSVRMTATLPTSELETYRSMDAIVRLEFPANSTQSYYINVELTEGNLAEIGNATICTVGPGLTDFTVGLRLLAEYFRSGLNNVVTRARVYLGLIKNLQSTSTDHYLEFRLGITALGFDLTKASYSVPIILTPYWFGGNGMQIATGFTVNTNTTAQGLNATAKVFYL
ncbi:hypothetical protein FGIG_01555 [Fasciola gigantica]|uniref:Uncharacterized protein n=1 Tax=Fasciola gigantica TaxID=46835 RepID=A0A504YQR7_FASGI|nr:hypothetical protein FGIG_01555 [Fasciola gigantica]